LGGIILAGNQLVKVTFNLPESDWHKSATESIWAEPIGNDQYRLDNVPFYVYGVGYNDIVIAIFINGLFTVQQVAQHRGHSTYRIILSENITENDFKISWQPLEKLDCTYEKATKRLFAIDVPPKTDIYKVYSALEEGEKQGTWDFEEAYCGHPLNKQ